MDTGLAGMTEAEHALPRSPKRTSEQEGRLEQSQLIAALWRRRETADVEGLGCALDEAEPAGGPGGGQRGSRVRPPLRGRRARLDDTSEQAVDGSHRDRRHRQPVARDLAENVEGALNQRRFGDDGERVAIIAEH